MNNEFGLAFSSVTVSLAVIIPDTPIVSIAGSTLSEITTTTTSTTTTPTPTPLSSEPTNTSADSNKHNNNNKKLGGSGGGGGGGAIATLTTKPMSDVNKNTTATATATACTKVDIAKPPTNNIQTTTTQTRKITKTQHKNIYDLSIADDCATNASLDSKLTKTSASASTTSIPDDAKLNENLVNDCKSALADGGIAPGTLSKTASVPSLINLQNNGRTKSADGDTALVDGDAGAGAADTATPSAKHELTNNGKATRTKDGLKDWDESRLKELLDEAYSYKNPRDKENKSEAFLQLLKETENEKEDQNFTFPALTSRNPRNSSASTTSNNYSHHHHSHQYKQGGSLQDIMEALHSDPNFDFYAYGGGQRTRNRHNHNSRQKKYATTVSSRQREGGSLPSNVNVTTCGGVVIGGADGGLEQQPLFVSEAYKNATNKQQKRNVKAAAAAATAAAKETDSEFSALLTGISKGAKTFEKAQSSAATGTKEHNSKSESSVYATKWAWPISTICSGTTISSSNHNCAAIVNDTTSSSSSGDCVIEVGELMDIQQQQQIMQLQVESDQKGGGGGAYYDRLDSASTLIPRANIIASASGTTNMAPANTHSFVDETVRFATMEQSSKAINASNVRANGAAASADTNAGGNTLLSNAVVSVDPATLCVVGKTSSGALEYLPLNENYQSCKSLLGMSEKANDAAVTCGAAATTATLGSAMFATTKTTTRQFDENGNALHELYQSNNSTSIAATAAAVNSILGSASTQASTTINLGSAGGGVSGISAYTSSSLSAIGSAGVGQSQAKPKAKKKSQKDRNTKTVDVVSVAGYRGNDPVEVLVKYIESNDDTGGGGGGGSGGANTLGSANSKCNDKEKKKERKKEKEKQKMKKSNSLEELRSGAKMEVDELKRTAATTESGGVLMRNKSKTNNKNNSASTADINKNFGESGAARITGAGSNQNGNNNNTVTTARKGERRSWGTEELQYLGGNEISAKSEEKLATAAKTDRAGKHKNKEREKEKEKDKDKEKEKEKETAGSSLAVNVTNHVADKEKPEKQEKPSKDTKEAKDAQKERLAQEKSDKNLSESTDKLEKRKKSVDAAAVNALNSSQALTVVDILAIDSLLPETAEFHVVTKKKKTKKQQQRAATLEDNATMTNYNFSNAASTLTGTTMSGGNNMQQRYTTSGAANFNNLTAAGNGNKPYNTNAANSYKYNKYYHNAMDNHSNNNNVGYQHVTNQRDYHAHNPQHAHQPYPHHMSNKHGDKSRRKSTSSMPPSEKSDSSDLDSVHSLPIESTSKAAAAAPPVSTTNSGATVANATKTKQRQKQSAAKTNNTPLPLPLPTATISANKQSSAPQISYADIARINRESASIAAAANAKSPASGTNGMVDKWLSESDEQSAGANAASAAHVNADELNASNAAAVSTTTGTNSVAQSVAVSAGASVSATQKPPAKSKKMCNKPDFPELVTTTSAAGTLQAAAAAAQLSTLPSSVAQTGADLAGAKPGSAIKVISYSQSLTSALPLTGPSPATAANVTNAIMQSKESKETSQKTEKPQRYSIATSNTTTTITTTTTAAPNVDSSTAMLAEQSNVPTAAAKQPAAQQLLQKSKSVDNDGPSGGSASASASASKSYNCNSSNMDQQYPALQKTVKRHSAANVISMTSPTLGVTCATETNSNIATVAAAAAPATTSTAQQFNFAAAAKQQAMPTAARKKSKEKSPPLSTDVATSTTTTTTSNTTTTRKTKKDKQTAISGDCANNTPSPPPPTTTTAVADSKQCVAEAPNAMPGDTVEFGTATASIATHNDTTATQAKPRNGNGAPKKSKAQKHTTSNSAHLKGTSANNGSQSNMPASDNGTQARPAVIILNDHRQAANPTSNDFTFGDFNEEEMKFFDEDDEMEQASGVPDADIADKQQSEAAPGKTLNSSTQTTKANYLNDSGTSSEVASSSNVSQNAVDVDMMLSTSADASSSPNASFAATSQLGVVNQSNDSGIYATAVTASTNQKLNSFLSAAPATVANTHEQASVSATACPQLETCNDIETAIIAAARAAAAEQQQQQLQQQQQPPNTYHAPYQPAQAQHYQPPQQQYQNSYSTSSSFSSTTSVSMDGKYPQAHVANDYNYKYQPTRQHQQHQRQQHYYSTHTSRRQHYDYDCEYNNQLQLQHQHQQQHFQHQHHHHHQPPAQYMRSRSCSSSSQRAGGMQCDDYAEGTSPSPTPMQQHDYVSNATYGDKMPKHYQHAGNYVVYAEDMAQGRTPSPQPADESTTYNVGSLAYVNKMLPPMQRNSNYVVYADDMAQGTTPSPPPAMHQCDEHSTTTFNVGAPAYVHKMLPTQHYPRAGNYIVYAEDAADQRSPSPAHGNQHQDFSASAANDAPAFVNKILPHKDIEIHYRPPTVLATMSSKHQNDVIVDFIGTAWEEVANSKVTQYYDGQ